MLCVGGDSNVGQFGEIRPEDGGSLQQFVLTGVVLLVLVVIIKALGSKGKLLKGGIVSGHSAAGFFLAATIIFIWKNAFSAVLAGIMALLIAQSRVEGKIHTLREVIIGALLAIILTSIVYYFVPLINSLHSI